MTTKRTGIQKTSNGRFKARYFRGYDSQSGKRIYPSKTFDTMAEARDWLGSEIGSRTLRTTSGRGVTLGAFMDHWLETRLGLRENSREAYRSAIEAHIKPSLGDQKLARLDGIKIERWQTDLLKRVSGSTVIFARSVLFGALESARKKDIIRVNPVSATESPKKNAVTRYPLSVDDVLQFTAACGEGKRLGLLFRLMVTCGLRPEEAIGLQWGAIDLSADRGAIRVERVIHYLKGGAGWRWHEPKTKSGERIVVFHGDLAARLLDHRRAQLEKKMRAGQSWQDNDLIFCSNLGHPIRYCTLLYQFKATLQRAGLPSEIKLYDLRHFFITSSLLAGVNAKVVSREAGHSDVAFTLQTYGNVLTEMHEDAASLRENLMRTRAKK